MSADSEDTYDLNSKNHRASLDRVLHLSFVQNSYAGQPSGLQLERK
jgi:hypothetical protein